MDSWPARPSSWSHPFACERLNQRCVALKVRLGGETVHGRRHGPRQFFGSEDFDKRHVPIVLVQHGCANIDEKVEAMGMCEHPVLAVWTVELPVWAM
jgi:hypothetical protein